MEEKKLDAETIKNDIAICNRRLQTLEKSSNDHLRILNFLQNQVSILNQYAEGLTKFFQAIKKDVENARKK